MNIYELMAKLGSAGVKLWVEEGQLKFKAPKGALTGDLKSELVALKQEVIDFLSSSSGANGSKGIEIPVVDHSQPLPLSFAQHRLWFIEQLTPGTSTFHISAPLNITGRLNYAAMELAFKKLIERHAILRTAFQSIDDEPFQVISDAVDFNIPVIEMNVGNHENAEEDVKAKIEAEMQTPFDLTKAPLVRAKIFKFSDHQHAMIIVFHHIITDGWSMAIFVRELISLYSAQNSGFGAELEPLPIQYADFAVWQREWLQGEVLEKQLSYWREQLTNAPAELSFPYDFPRPKLLTNNGAVIRVKFSPEVTQSIRSIARQFDCTAYVVLMSAYKILLSRWSGQSDICVGMPIAGRTQSQTEPLIGFFVNQLVIRSQQYQGQSFAQFIFQIKRKILEAQSHQDVPFEAIVDDLNLERHLEYSPLFQAALSLTGSDSGEQSINIGGLSIKPREADLIAARLEMTLMLVDYGDHISGMMEYNSDLFRRETVALFLEQYQSLLINIAQDCNEVLANISVYSQQTLQKQFNVQTGQILVPLSSVSDCEGDNWSARCLEQATSENALTDSLIMLCAKQPILRTRIRTHTLKGIDSAFLVFEPKPKIVSLFAESAFDHSQDAIEYCRAKQAVIKSEDTVCAVCYFVVTDSAGKIYLVVQSDSRVLDSISIASIFNEIDTGSEAGSDASISENQVLQAFNDLRRRIDTPNAIDNLKDYLNAIEPELVSHQQTDVTVISEYFDEALLTALRGKCQTHELQLSSVMMRFLRVALAQNYYHNDAVIVISMVDARTQVSRTVLGPFSCQNIFTEQGEAQREWVAPETRRCLQGEHWFEAHCDFSVLDFSGAPNGLMLQKEGHSNSGLMFSVSEINAGFKLSLQLPSDFNDYGLLARIKHLAQCWCSGSSFDALAFELLPDEKAILQRWEFGASRPLAEPTILALLEKHVTQNGEQSAVICGDKKLSYREFDRISTNVAHWVLQTIGQSNSSVAICIGRSLYLPVVFWGAVKAGVPYVPMDVTYPNERIQHLVADSQSRLFITESNILQRLKDSGTDLPSYTNVVLIDDLINECDRLNALTELPLVLPEKLLYYVYTSGSTGKPKGAGVYHRGEANLIAWYKDLLSLTAQDRVLVMSAMGFDLTQKNLFVALCSGATLVVPEFDEYDPYRLLQTLLSAKVSVVNCAPSAFYPLVAAAGEQQVELNLRHLVLGGEPIQFHLLEKWFAQQDNTCILTNSYGPTECTDVVASYSLDASGDVNAPLPIGRPIQNVLVCVVNEKGSPIRPGSVGELCISGICVGSGYLNQPELTSKVFRTHQNASETTWYHTGDLVQFNDSGDLVYVGRKDFQLKLRGLRIEPNEINALLKQQANVADALTIVADERLVSFVVGPETLDQQQVKQELQRHLPEFMVPASIITIPRWPLTPNGKVDRDHLLEIAKQQELDYQAPRNSMEAEIASIWAQILKRDRVSVTANFFELGGHSLLATQIISRVRQAFHVELSVRALFEAPTVESLANYITHSAATGAVDSIPPLVALDTPNRDTLSFAQYRLWFVDQLNEGSSEYNLPYALKIKGPLKTDILDQVFAEIIRRHEVLRTRFLAKDGVPQLVVDEIPSWHSPVDDLSALGESEQAQAIERIVDEDANKVFSLQNDTLFSSRILKLADDQYVLVINMHHIVADGWSMGVLVQELQTLYAAFVANKPSPLPELAIQYADFSVWQRQWLSGDVLQKLTQYWQHALAGAPDVLRLPTDKPRPKVQTFNGAHYPVALGLDFSAKINAFCERMDLTPFMVLIGAYHILLSRYSGQKDICVGIPIAGRNHAEIEGLIGFFINGLVIRSRLEKNPSVADYLRQIKDTALDAYAHQDMPADVLLDALKLDRNADTSPGAQVSFALQNVDVESFHLEIAGLDVEFVEREHKTAKYELSLILQEQQGEFVGVIEFNTDLFEVHSIERMLTHYRRILAQILENPNRDLDQIELLQAADLPELFKLDVAPDQLRLLSPMQRDMVIDTQIQPDTLKNSLGYHLLIDQPFEADLWQQALQQVSDDQPLLRSSLVFSDYQFTDVAYLRVAKTKTVELKVVDQRNKQLTEHDANTLAKSLIWQPYQLAGDLVEYYLYQYAHDRSLVVVRMNHIIVDGRALAIHLQNALAYYQAAKGEGIYKPAPDIFPTYVADNRQRTDRHEVIEFWQSKAQQTEALDFSQPSYAAQEHGRIERSLKLTAQHWQAVQDFCKAQRITPSLYFKALYGMLIYAYCRPEQDFFISEVTGGRSGTHKRSLGNYFQILPIVFEKQLFGAGHTAQILMNYVRHYRKTLKTNAQVSLMTIGQTLPQGRLQFLFNYYDFIPSMTLFGQGIQVVAHPQCQDGPVQLVVEEQAHAAELHLIYLAELFTDLDFLERLQFLSEQLLSGVSQMTDFQWALPTETASSEQAHSSGKVAPLPMNTVLEGISRQTQMTPQNIAILHGNEEISYAQLDRLTNQLANCLINNGIIKGDRVAICLDRGPNMLVAVLAALKAGAVYVPLDSNYPIERLNYIFADCQAKALVTQDCVLQHFKDADLELSIDQIIDLEQLESWQPQTAERPVVCVSASDPIYMIYTSGSTGKPKGVVVNHDGEANLQQWYIETLAMSATDKVLLVSAFGFDLTQKNLFAPLLVGASLVIPAMDEYDVDCVTTTIKEQRISVINCAPSMFYPLVESVESNVYPQLRVVILGGEPIRLSLLQPWLQQSQCRLINSYGPTECSDVVAFHEVDINADAAVPIPIGKAIQNTHLYVVDELGIKLPAGIVGELCIGGLGVGEGYFQQPELTTKVFSNNPYGKGKWYRTGDLVRQWPDGNIEFVGRKDFQIKLRGLRIELSEIEAVLQAQSGVEDSLTLVKDERLVSYIITNATIDSAMLKNQLRQALPAYMVPAVIVSLTQWPLTPNGKIDRNNLPDADESERPTYVPPRTETEEKLVAIWQEILGLEKIGVHDSFFDLGGHSLLAARAVSKFRQTFEVDIQLRALFEMQTIEDIAQYLDATRWAADAATQSADLGQEQDGREQGFL